MSKFSGRVTRAAVPRAGTRKVTSVRAALARRRVAVVTGANRGLGLEIARQLARLGIRVVMAARDEAKARRAALDLRSERLDVLPAALDVGDATSLDRFVRWLRLTIGRADILVNNAGVRHAPPGGKGGAIDVPLRVMRESLEVNTLGPLAICQALVPLMRERGYGRIVNVSASPSLQSSMGAGWPAYRVSKNALNVLTRALARELRGTGVLVNAVCPGWSRTEMGGPDATRTPAEGADTAVWLATLPDDGPTGGLFRDRTPIEP